MADYVVGTTLSMLWHTKHHWREIIHHFIRSINQSIMGF